MVKIIERISATVQSNPDNGSLQFVIQTGASESAFALLVYSFHRVYDVYTTVLFIPLFNHSTQFSIP